VCSEWKERLRAIESALFGAKVDRLTIELVLDLFPYFTPYSVFLRSGSGLGREVFLPFFLFFVFVFPFEKHIVVSSILSFMCAVSERVCEG
jgi:hypothetical protein